MKNFAKGAAIALFSLALVACSSNSDDNEISTRTPPDELYSQAKTSMDVGNYTKAARILEALDSRYPFGPYKIQGQLDLIYSYYKLNDVASGLANVDRFIRLNPTSPSIDYVYYMRGLINMQADDYFFHDLVNIDRTDRDPKFAQAAFKDFDQLLKNHPDSAYAADARLRMTALKNQLARYSLQVAEYYYKIEAWIAAANRAQQVVENFPGSPSTQRALEIMADSYGKLGQTTLEQNVLMVIRANNY